VQNYNIFFLYMPHLTKINSLTFVGKFIHEFLCTDIENYSIFQKEFHDKIIRAEIENPWFTKDNILFCLEYWAENLTQEKLSHWLSKYNFSKHKNDKIGIIMAGNIPMVGFHDALCVLLAGFSAKIKLSTKDKILIPFLLNYWKELDPSIEFEFIERVTGIDKLIATGSDNTSKYFEYYFKEIPHIIRKNRTSVAVLNGNETKEELENLSKDIFTYYGLGCRNVTQLFLPKEFKINHIFEAVFSYKEVINHNKYGNNYDYHKAIFLLNRDNFWDNNFLLLKESNAIFSPISVLNFSFYEDLKEIENFIMENENKIQCIVSNENFPFETVTFGQSQLPMLDTYADGIDTMQWICEN